MISLNAHLEACVLAAPTGLFVEEVEPTPHALVEALLGGLSPETLGLCLASPHRASRLRLFGRILRPLVLVGDLNLYLFVSGFALDAQEVVEKLLVFNHIVDDALAQIY